LSNLNVATATALISTRLSAEIREQFGRPIGQFQAVKHKCAEMIADTERATAAVWDAARAVDEARENNWETAGSKAEFATAVTATLAPAAAQRCTQVHGGIEFTWEHDTNVYYRRALVIVAGFGRKTAYPQRVVDITTSNGMRALDIDLDPGTERLRAEIRAEVAGLKEIPRDEHNTAIAEPAGCCRICPSRGGVPPTWNEYLLAGRATTIYGGTSEVQLNIIAERLVGLLRDR